ncbi:RNA ligase family protein [Halorussus ruber]|uniref:RNA ligase family protein n=1 Tax=Halorussus ruber TaxID=1126238 RepID=UPI001092D54B|nr:RNA ligase family protein [Halorussus ruber]
MKQFPPVPRAEEAPADLFDAGHLWIQERIDGLHLRFRLRESGVLEFGDRQRVYGSDTDDVPLAYHHAVRHARESFDREALRASVEDLSSVVFFAEATVRRAIDYDWGRTPSILGFDVWNGAEERFLPPDSVERVYDRLGLDSVNVFQKEARAIDFSPESYEVPSSAWYDGPAAGVVVRNKTGQRAVIRHPDFESEPDAEPLSAPADELAERYATRQRVEAVARRLESAGRPVTFDAVYERVVEAIAREEYHRLFHEQSSVDLSDFRSEVAARTQEFLSEI